MKTFIAVYTCNECGIEAPGKRPDTPFSVYDYVLPEPWVAYVPPKPKAKVCPTCGVAQLPMLETGYSFITTMHLPPELPRSRDETCHFCCDEHRATWLAKRETAEVA